MRKYFSITLFFFILPMVAICQEEGGKNFDKYISRKLKVDDLTISNDTEKMANLTQKAAEAVQTDAIDYGPRIRAVFSIGPTYSGIKIDDPYLSPLDSTLHFQGVNRASCVISGGVAIPFGRGAIHAEDESAQDPKFHQHPARLAALVLLNASNLVAFSGSSTPFNQKVNGGIGIGYSLNKEDNSLLIGLTVDFNTARQLRDEFYNFDGRQITYKSGSKTKAYGQLDASNNQFFYDKLTIGATLRLVYVISGKKSKSDN